MRKLLFTFFGLILCSALGWGADPVGYFHYSKTESEIASENKWTKNQVYTSFKIGNVTFATVNSSDETNGKYRNGNEWMLYRQYSNGPLTVTADDNYWIADLAFKYNINYGGVIADKPNDDDKPQVGYANDEIIPVNKKVMNLYVGRSTVRTSGNYGFIGCTNFAVSYYKIPTSITLTSAQLNVGGSATIARNILPADASDSLVWESSAPAVATVDKTGKVTAVATGYANITATGIGGVVKGTCVVTVANDGKSVVETFGGKTYAEDQTKENTIEGTIATWKYQKTLRSSNANYSLKSTTSYATWFRNATDAHIATTKALEGGIKRVSFLWNKQSPNQRTANFIISAGSKASDNVNVTFGVNDGKGTRQETPDWAYSHDFEVKENVALSIYNNNDNCYVLIGDIVVTPYLLFKEKKVDINCKETFSYNFKPVLIDNTGGTVSYAVTDAGGTGCAGSFENGVLDLRDVTATGKIVVKASWNDGKVYTTDTLNVTDAYPAPASIRLNMPTSISATKGNTFPLCATVLPANANPYLAAISWESNAEDVVSVVNGKITALKAGIATITAKTGNNISATCEITVKDTTYTSFTENFQNLFTTSDSYEASNKLCYADNGLVWQSRNYKFNDNTMVGSQKGIELQCTDKTGYITYYNAQEGGVKSVSFYWKAVEPTKNVQFSIDDATSNSPFKKDTFTLVANADYANPQLLSKDLNYTSNVYFRIRQGGKTGSAVAFGPITVTPYLLYTTKVADAYKVGYKNDALINNTTGEAVVYSLEGEHAASATINSATGEITDILSDDTVTVKASWNSGKVYTTYKLALHLAQAPEVEFSYAARTVDMNKDTVINALKWTSDPTKCGAVTYESDDEEVATVVKEGVNAGLVSIVGEGTANITAHIAKGSDFAAKDITYALTVEDPMEDAIIEKFTAYKDGGWTGTPIVVTPRTGDYFDWNILRTRHRSDDLIGSERATIFNPDGTSGGYIESQNAVEGGIKRIGFNWSKNAVADGQFQVIVGLDTCTIYSGATKVLSKAYNHNFLKKENASLKIFNSSASTMYVGDIKITPYLLYTKKDTTIKAIDYVGKTVFQNNEWINNTNGGTIEYSILSQTPAGIAQILSENVNNGKVTILGGGDVTVQAKWEDVTTTYTLHITKETPTITNLVNSNIDILFQTYAPNPVAKIGNDTIKDAVFEYTIVDEKILTRDASGNFINKRTGKTDVTCKLLAGPTYNEATQTKYVNVTEPNASKCWKETFDSLPEQKTFYTGGSAKKINGDLGVYKWQIKNYRHLAGVDSVNHENGIFLKRATGASETSNYLAFDGQTEWGGVKGYYFNWSILGGETRTAKFTVRVNPSIYDETYEIPNTVPGEYYSCAKMIDKPTDGMFRLGVPTENDSVIFGPVTIVPYLLYTKRDTTINIAEYLADPEKRFENDAIINNTEAELSSDDITFSIKNETEETQKIATVDATTGKVTVKSPGTVTVKAAWQGVSTTYTLHIEKAAYTPTFAEPTVEKTMNDSAFVNTLTVPEGIGAKTFSNTNERVAKVDNEGKVTIYGPGTDTIKVEIGAGTIYEKASAKYVLKVTEPTTDTDIVEGFTDLSWSTSSKELAGDLCDWKTYCTRREQADTFNIKGEKVYAEWFRGDSMGYLESKTPVEGGVKRIAFEWIKNKPGDASTPTILVKVGDTEDLYDVTGLHSSTPYTYIHNFNIRKNSVIKIHNNSPTNFKASTIRITPYIFFTEDVNLPYATAKKVSFGNSSFINNTEEVGEITYKSSDNTIASVNSSGMITAHKPTETPITITAVWKLNADAQDSITASFLLTMPDKSERNAAFAQTSITVARGATPVNNITFNTSGGDSKVDTTYFSSDTEVAIVENNKIKTIAPGTTTIKAVLSETDKFRADSATYTLNVTYAPAENTYFTETFPGTKAAAATNYQEGPDTITGVNGFYSWGLKRYRRSSSDMVGGQQAIRICYQDNETNAYLATIGAQEGGLKEVVFDYSVPGSATNVVHFLVQVGESTHDFHHAPIITGSEAHPYAHTFNEKSNTNLSIVVNALEDPAQAAINVAPVKIVPYLLYTRKDTMVYAKDLADKNFKFFNNKWYNNTNGEGKISYSVKAKDNAVTMEGDSVKIIGEGTDTIQASWEGVTTTYVIHTVLEDAKLAFAQDQVTVYLDKTNEYKAEISKDTDAEVNYEFIGEHGSATIDKEGNVHFTEADTLTIRASVEQKLPYKAGADTLTLIVSKALPELSFSPDEKEVTMNEVSFTHTATVTKGEGAPVYSSSDITVAKVNANTGKVTVVGAGNVVITATMVESEEWAEAKATYSLTVTDPMDDAVAETFPGLPENYAYEVKDLEGNVANWSYLKVRHNAVDVLADQSNAMRLGNADDAYIVTKDTFEGGIKRVSFKWNKASPDVRTAKFIISAGDDLQNQDTVIKTIGVKGQTPLSTDIDYNHNFNVKKNVKLKISNTKNECYTLVGAVKITPYLLYTMKDTTIKVGESYTNKNLIDNRDDETAITYSIIAGNEKGVASIDTKGNVSANRACELTIQAKWKTSEKDSVTTTYNLSIVPDKTTITLVRDNGTEEVDVIENSYRTVMPQFTLPTRTGYRFNAYWTAAKGKGIRFTVTTDKGVTAWVKDRWINPDSLVDGNRKWIYEGTTYTLYAEWRPERKIALDNQGATTPGTDTVVTAYCPNNNLLRLTQSITKPAKTNSTFMGYYTEENGAGSMLIDANGAFVASVENYTDSSKWFIKDADITLYAYWVLNKMTLKESEDNSANIAMCAGHTVDVELVRSLNSSMLNTFCLPFDVNEDMMIDIFGENYQLITFKSAVLNAKKDSIDLRFKTATSIQAGVPYLIQPSKEVKNPTFEQVTVVNTTGKPAGTGSITMYGVINPTHVSAGNTILLMANNQFTWTNEEAESEKMKGMRAYFEVDEEAKAALRRYSPRLCVDQADTPTELMQNAQCTMQSVRKMIMDNQLVIIREGKMFNAQGALVK